MKELSIKLGRNLGHKLGANDEDAAVYAYGLEVLLCHLVKIILLFSLAAILKLSLPTLLVLLAWSGFRIPGGGAHMENYSHCLSTGTIVILSLAAISTIDLSLVCEIVLLFLTSLLGLMCIIYWVPAGTEKKQVLQAANRLKQKRETTIFLLLWIISVVCLMILGYSHSVLALLLGAIGGLWAITPFGYHILGGLDRSLLKLERRCKQCWKKQNCAS